MGTACRWHARRERRPAHRAFFAPELLLSHSRLTDGYLLALAHAKGGRLATMDQKLAVEVVPRGKGA